MGHSPGGFRGWRALTGSDETLENAIPRLAGRFSRRIRGYAKAHDIPVIDCAAGQRKHDLAGEYLAQTKVTQGLFLVLVGRAQAPVWDVGAKHHIERKKPMPYVNHYSFHILDADWGHLTIKISGHPPFPAQVILNGHEYVACQARKAGIVFTKEGGPLYHRSLTPRVWEDRRHLVRAPGYRAIEPRSASVGFTAVCASRSTSTSRSAAGSVTSRQLSDRMFQALIDRSRFGYRHRPIYRRRTKRSAEWGSRGRETYL